MNQFIPLGRIKDEKCRPQGELSEIFLLDFTDSKMHIFSSFNNFWKWDVSYKQGHAIFNW